MPNLTDVQNRAFNANNRTYTQFTPSQINKLDLPSRVLQPEVGNFPRTDFPAQVITKRRLDQESSRPLNVQGNIFRRDSPTEQAFNGVGSIAGILGAASLAAPILAPAAAAAGIGYGVYKLGQNFKLW